MQREDLLPLDLATFVTEREQAGDSRAEIARRLGKARSLITEVAELAQAPAVIRQVHDEGRCRDVRALYLLVRAHREQPQAVETLVAGTAEVTREQVEAFAAHEGVVGAKPVTSKVPHRRVSPDIGPSTALAIEVDGQEATLDLNVTGRPSTITATVRFLD